MRIGKSLIKIRPHVRIFFSVTPLVHWFTFGQGLFSTGVLPTPSKGAEDQHFSESVLITVPAKIGDLCLKLRIVCGTSVFFPSSLSPVLSRHAFLPSVSRAVAPFGSSMYVLSA